MQITLLLLSGFLFSVLFGMVIIPSNPAAYLHNFPAMQATTISRIPYSQAAARLSAIKSPMQVNAVSGREGSRRSAPDFVRPPVQNTIVVPWAIWCDFTQIRTVSI